ncbi:hypothetical protein RZS08_43175, partial [Arthrospira platensis SPKY1]|nr:hypothetical protein [Arthrospira platensis SPKY1]
RLACQKRAENGLKTVLALDDADALSEEVLAWLVSAIGAGSDALSLVLSGRDELWNRLRESFPDLVEQKLLGRIPLKPLSRSEVRSYLEQALKRRGWSGQ